MKLLIFALVLAISYAQTDIIRIALYGGEGAVLGDPDYPYKKTLETAANEIGPATVTIVQPKDIVQNLTNEAFDLVFFPGGSGQKQAASLGDDGLNAVRNFVENGGAYIGTCAGAFLGMNSLYLYGRPGPEVKSLGTGMVKVAFTEQGFRDFSYDRNRFAGNVSIYYQGGPVFSQPSLPSDVNVLARFTSPVPSYLPNPQGVGTPAITSSTFGKGRVVLNSPHAEHKLSAGIGPAFYLGQIKWVLLRK